MKALGAGPCVLAAALSLSVFACCGPRREPAAETAQARSWRVLGPGGGGGQFLPTINPQDSNHVFVRCDMTGAYVTLDGGRSWRMFNLRTVVRDFEFDPGRPDRIYAANSGLYVSEDRGRRWRLVYPDPANVVAERMIGDHANQRFETVDGMPDASIDKIRVDPADSERIYLGLAAPHYFSTARGLQYLKSAARVLVTSDRGATWRTLAEIKGRSILGIFPGSPQGKPDELTVVTDQACVRVSVKSGELTELALPVERIITADGGSGSQGSIIYILTEMKADNGSVSGGIYRSLDRGASWEQVNRGLLEDWPTAGRLPEFRTMAVSEGHPEVAYLSCSTYPAAAGNSVERQFGIFKTGNGGKKWSWTYRANEEKVITDNHLGSWMMRNYGPEWGEYPLSLGVSPTDPDICYATDFGATYRTLDGGRFWEQVYSNNLPDGSVTSRGLDVTTCYGVHFDPFDKDHFFISYTDIGLWHTLNGGRSWRQAINGVPRRWINTCYWLVFDPQVQGRIWSVWGSGHDLPRPKMFRSGRFDRFVGGVAVTEDGGGSWSPGNTGMPPNTVCTHVLLDENSPKEARTLYVCGFGKGVFKSIDSGRTWKLCNNGLGRNLNAWQMVLLPDGTLLLLVARGLENRETVDGKLYVSTDRAETWQASPLPQGANAPNDLVFDPDNPRRMYLSCWPWTDRENMVERCGGLYRTEDGGETWEQVFDEQAHVYAAAVDPDNTSTVYINTFDSAAFRSDDRGRSWYRLEGYNFKWGHRPLVDPHNPGMLYLTTFGGSVFHGPAGGVPGAFEDIEEDDFLRW